MSSWLLALLASSQVPYELLALVFQYINVFFVIYFPFYSCLGVLLLSLIISFSR